MGIDLIQPAFRMQIHLIEEGSPATTTGKLKAGQMIQSINGQVLQDIETVKNWAREVKPVGITWTFCYGGIGLCEYYLRTDDKEAFDNIQA